MNKEILSCSLNRCHVVLIIAVCYILFVGFDILSPTGWVGVTKKYPELALGCFCHNHIPSDSVHVWITGPDSVQMGRIASYAVHLSGGFAIAGGFDLASAKGALAPSDTSTHLQANDFMVMELTHSFPKSFQSGEVEWRFSYQAPPKTGLDTFFTVGNSVDSNGIAKPPDEWNFGENFVVRITDTTADVENSQRPITFRLEQNFPNPFNPGTTIKYGLSNSSTVSLSVYNIQGQKVATLVDGRKQPGEYSIHFDGFGLAGGIYICRLDAGDFIQTRKMLFLR